MRTQQIAFERPIKKFEDLLEQLKDCDPIRMKTRADRNRLRQGVQKRIDSSQGIYVFLKQREENEEPQYLYVGRTDQMADRLLNHGHKPNKNVQSSATFALILAKYEFKRTYSVQDELFSKELARKLNKNSELKMKLWTDAVEQVKGMLVKVVKVEHPHEQAVFEVYAHERLHTPFNSFANH